MQDFEMNNFVINPIVKEQRKTSYTHFLLDVIEWNKTAESTGTAAGIDKQIMLVREEVEELFEAFDSGDVEGFYKELTDCFVVAGYAANLKWGVREAEVCFCDDLTYLMARLEDAVVSDPTAEAFSIILDIMNSLDQTKVIKYLNATLRSNWSKFFVGDTVAEVGWATKAYEGRYEGITAQKDMYGTYCLKDSRGKILKPSTFKDYKEYL